MAAFAKAFAGGGCVHVPAGTYVLGPKPLDVPANVVLKGDGRATVLMPAPQTAELLRLKHGAQIRNLSIHGKNVKSGSVSDGLIVVRVVAFLTKPPYNVKYFQS